MDIYDIAKLTHEANMLYCQSIGDHSQMPWEQAPGWQRTSAINGVKFHLDNPDAGPDHSHNEWMREKVDAGWVFGEVKDEAAKTHPCLVAYEDLPREQQMKDFLFRNIVHAAAECYPELRG